MNRFSVSADEFFKFDCKVVKLARLRRAFASLAPGDASSEASGGWAAPRPHSYLADFCDFLAPI
jgi:hypothetical protein